MKKLLAWSLVLLLSFTAAGCGKAEDTMPEGKNAPADEMLSDTEEKGSSDTPQQEIYEASENDFLANASPETSALAMYCYDGENVSREFLFDQKTVKEIIADLLEVDIKSAPEWTPEMVTAPIYGIEIGGKDGYAVFGAWSNGYWITAEGEAYEFMHDFEALAGDYGWESLDSFQTINVLPCARHLVQKGNQWYSGLLTPAYDKTAPEGVALAIVDQTRDMLTAEVTNGSSEEWFFGEYFSIEVQVDDAWYQVPATPGNWAFHDIGLILPAGETMEMEYHLRMYGELPAGNYRLVVEDMTAEFVIE